MSKILVTGSNGQVGSELKELSSLYKQFEMTFIDRSVLDMSNPDTVNDYLKNKTFDVIINCAAYTAVDKAEAESELADLINHKAVEALARVAKEKNIKLVHISTDYVFDGKSHLPYVESDLTNPVSVYGKTKLAGEQAILSIAPANTIVLRTAWVYSSFGNNFVKTMLRLGREWESLGVVFDQIGSPTYARDLARLILDILPLIKNTSPVIYNYSNEGVTSWYDFAKTIFELCDVKCIVNPITSAQYPTPAKRPHCSLLNKNKIKDEFKIEIPHWKDSLQECLKKL